MIPMLFNKFVSTIEETSRLLSSFTSPRREGDYYVRDLGRLRAIIIYPLDGGIPFEVRRAVCTEYGLKDNDLVDRAYVAYSPRSETAILNVHDPSLATKNIDHLLNKIRIRQNNSAPLKTIRIKYLGTSIMVQDLGNDVTVVAEETFGYKPGDIRIAYCSPEERKSLVHKGLQPIHESFIEDVDYRSPYYSPYTLLNSKSLRYMNDTTGERINPWIFRANLVFEGHPRTFRYCEDYIYSLCIGRDIKFDNFAPCTHTSRAFLNENSGPDPSRQEPYIFLKRTRTKKDERKNPPSDFKYPVFGRNMSLQSPEGKIKVGDYLIATFFY